MSRLAMKWMMALPAAVLACLSVGCSAPAPLIERELYDQANLEFEDRHFETATKRYEELLEQYPFSDLAEVARLRIAHAYYLSHEYEKAVAAFNDFERLHPTSPNLGFVEYTIGMAYLDQVTSRDRDKSAAESALQQFERVRDGYPDSLYGRLAVHRILQCRENLANHELYVGDYYAEAGKRRAARARYRFVLETYPLSDAAISARERIATLGPEAEDKPDSESSAEVWP